VVRRLNRVALDLGEMATLVYVSFDPSSGRGRLVSAGHLPVLVRRANGECAYLEADGGLPLGVRQRAKFVERLVGVEPGSLLLLYTDGLVERRDASLDDGWERLAQAMSRAPAEPAAACDHVVQALLGTDRPGDDVALLALQRLDVPSEQLALRLPAEPGALSHLRRVLRTWLDHAGADEAETYDLTLATHEAAANVVEHAYGPGDAAWDLSARSCQGVVEIVVRDFGRWREPRGTNRGRGLRLMEAFTDHVTVDHTEEGTRVQLRRRLTLAGRPSPPGGSI
jgi:anti-sigma regulatory factor (Ser/Thr protein kinase)